MNDNDLTDKTQSPPDENTASPNPEPINSKSKSNFKFKKLRIVVPLLAVATLIVGVGITFQADIMNLVSPPKVQTNFKNDYSTVNESTTGSASEETNKEAAPTVTNTLTIDQVKTFIEQEKLANQEADKLRIDTLVSSAVEKILADKEEANATLKLTQSLEREQKDIAAQTEIDQLTKKVADNKINKLPSVIYFTDKKNHEAKLKSVENKVNQLYAMFQEREVNISAVTASKPRSRLPEFNLLAEVDTGVYSVQSPTKNNKKHYITLYKGEPFYSKIRNHKVTGILKDGDKVQLLVDDDYYIDKKRREYTPEQLAQFKKKKVRHKKPSPTKKTQVDYAATKPTITSSSNIGKNPTTDDYKPTEDITPTVTTNVQPAIQNYEPVKVARKAQTNVRYLNGKILLNDWRVVDSRANEQAVVVNVASQDPRPMPLKINKYYPFFGLVQTVSNNAICSNQYCIGGLE